MDTFRRATLFLVAFVMGFGVTAAWATAVKDGKEAQTNSADGVSANVRGDSFNAPSNACVLYAATAKDYTSGSHRQIEAGVVRCNGVPFGKCDASGHVYVEVYDGTNYDCHRGGTFTNSTEFAADDLRDSNTSTTFHGFIGSAEDFQSGFGVSDDVHAQTFGEVTSGNSCPSSANGHFGYFSRYLYGQGWGLVTNPLSYNTGGPGSAFGPCWTVGISDNNGSYGVY